MASELITLPFRPVINLRGGLEAGALLDVFATGTTTRVSIYADADLTTPLTNPVVANAAGVFPAVYWDNTQDIRVRVRQANGTVLGNADPYFSDGLGATSISTATGETLQEALDGVATRTALKALTSAAGRRVYLTEAGREGVFIFRSGDYSAQIAADTREGIYIKADAVAASSGAWVRQYEGKVNAKWWGAKGDDSTNDKAAIQAAIDTVESLLQISPQGSATIWFPSGRYIVGSGADTEGLTLIKANLEGDSIFGTTLVWSGALDGTMLRWDATYRKRVNGFRWDSADSAKKPKYWIDGTYDSGLGGQLVWDYGDNLDHNFWTDVSSNADAAALNLRGIVNVYFRYVRFQGGTRNVKITMLTAQSQKRTFAMSDYTLDYGNSGAGVYSEHILVDLTGNASLNIHLQNARLEGTETMATDPALLRVTDTGGPNNIGAEAVSLHMENVTADFSGASNVNVVYHDTTQTGGSAPTTNIALTNVLFTEFATMQGGNWNSTWTVTEPTFATTTIFKHWVSGRMNFDGANFIGENPRFDGQIEKMSGEAVLDESNYTSGSFSGTTNGSGFVTVTHGLGSTPSQVFVQNTTAAVYIQRVGAKGATTFNVGTFDTAGAAVTGTAITFDWEAR